MLGAPLPGQMKRNVEKAMLTQRPLDSTLAAIIARMRYVNTHTLLYPERVFISAYGILDSFALLTVSLWG